MISALTKAGVLATAMAFWVGAPPCFAGAVITNPGFETPNLGTGFEYDPTGPDVGWTFSAGSVGIAANGSGFGVGGPGFGDSGSGAPAPEGTQIGFLQGSLNEINQSLSGFTIGNTFVFTFFAAQRPTSVVHESDPINTFAQTIEVLLDSKVIGNFTPSSTSYTEFTTSAFIVTDDLAHTLSFVGTNAAFVAAGEPSNRSDNTAFIDHVSLSTIPEPSSLAMGATAVGMGLLLALAPRVRVTKGCNRAKDSR